MSVENLPRQGEALAVAKPFFASSHDHANHNRGFPRDLSMNLKQLEVFIAVAESGSFSRAAEITFLTQSTVSQHISSLEKEFELKLLDRTGKGALLTEAGKLLLDRAQRVVAEARNVSLALNRFRGLDDVVLKIGGSNIPACYMIPHCVPAFHKHHPGVTISLIQGDSRETLDRLKDEEVEFALVGTRFADKGLAFTPLTLDKSSLVAPAGHPWSEKDFILPGVGIRNGSDPAGTTYQSRPCPRTPERLHVSRQQRSG